MLTRDVGGFRSQYSNLEQDIDIIDYLGKFSDPLKVRQYLALTEKTGYGKV
jgi:hypothetical protein